MKQYFKFKNSFEDQKKEWWVYAKIIRINPDGFTCQAFEFETTSNEQHFIAGMAKPFCGSINTNKYTYFTDYYEPCTKKEFDKALQQFMKHLNKIVVDEVGALKNAQLTSAAPILLKACKAVMSGGYGCAPSVEFMDKLKKQCEKAIDVAEGRTV